MKLIFAASLADKSTKQQIIVKAVVCQNNGQEKLPMVG